MISLEVLPRNPSKWAFVPLSWCQAVFPASVIWRKTNKTAGNKRHGNPNRTPWGAGVFTCGSRWSGGAVRLYRLSGPAGPGELGYPGEDSESEDLPDRGLPSAGSKGTTTASGKGLTSHFQTQLGGLPSQQTGSVGGLPGGHFSACVSWGVTSPAKVESQGTGQVEREINSVLLNLGKSVTNPIFF